MVVLLISLFPQTFAVAATDTAGHWAEDAIERWTEKGVLNGYTDGSFKPDDNITRGEFFKIISSAFEFEDMSDNPFSDIRESDWYYDHIIKLYAAGIINGSGGKVHPEAAITREEVFAVFARLFDVENDESALSVFSDGDKTSSWAHGEVGGLVAGGYIQGSDGQLRPTGNITRAEVVTVINNIIKGYYNTPGTYADNVSGTVVISSPGVSINGAAIAGDIYITAGAGEGSVKLTGVSVTGTIYVTGGDVLIAECDYEDLVVDSFDTAKRMAQNTIAYAKLPDSVEFTDSGRTIVIPGQEVTKYPTPDDKKVNPTIERDPNMVPYTNWPAVGIPAITSKYGNTAATGIYDIIDTMLDKASEDYDISKDSDFEKFLSFAEIYEPSAIAGTPVAAKTVYMVAVTGESNTPLAQEDDPDAAFASAYPENAPEYRVYTKAVEVGAGQINLRALSSIPLPAKYTRGIITPEHIDAYVYEFGINKDGIAVSFERDSAEAVQAYSATGNGKIRISYFDDEVFDIAPGAKLYDVTTGENATIELVGNLADLNETDWGRSIRAVFNENGAVVEAYRSGTADSAEPTSAAYLTAQKFDYIDGVRYDDPEFGYDGVENPYPVDFALYNPIIDAENTGANDSNALYPLFIFLHGFGSDSKNGIANVNSIGENYTAAEYQNEFETGTDGVTGAYIMMPRANGRYSHDLSAQGWIHGYRGDNNPRYAAGDEEYKGKATQPAALISNILWLIENENIDPDRIYITGQSAGGYMTWATLFESARLGYADLFAAAIPNAAVISPEGKNAEITGDYPENELGLREKILSVKDVPIWLRHGRVDTTCAWDYTIGAQYTKPEYAINGYMTMWEIVRSLSDGVSEVQGNPLTRVSIGNNLGHSSPYLATNNKYTVLPEALAEGENTTVYYSEIIGSEPEGYDELSPSEDAYAYGASEKYSSGSYADTIIGWLNMCGNAKAGN